MRRHNRDRPRLRMRGYDYARAGHYFVTWCTHERRRILGRVVGGQLQLTPAGAIVAEEIERTAQIRPSVRVDCYVVMPDHVHMLIEIRYRAAARTTSGRFESPSRTLGAAVRAIKAGATRRILGGCPEVAAPVWQTLYHESIIRGELSLARVRRYIERNPARWRG